ncbi:fimbrial protein SthA [Cronobacter sakazakii]|uniref:fimbrial protein SthA n=1 Tax=Cronobacter sakazakii TaxID=28141 RepID=UPI001F43A695|nr:fimbrial protein SthA [Cronobacter sakazakii]MDK1182120.1 fimbrial protein SthA [Cronobacter sakazakii]MDT3523505.1 fimbrial protein SthA [Cronobacter sakazakii]MEB8575724.1 fimbrial protein SthA [Cronobacter sakazakii]MEB8606521.1 fimbrial protein SthA [Cronobacter sakazakii]UWT86432.1 fimbrial protein SthA [Cronobacter sakazakii]
MNIISLLNLYGSERCNNNGRFYHGFSGREKPPFNNESKKELILDLVMRMELIKSQECFVNLSKGINQIMMQLTKGGCGVIAVLAALCASEAALANSQTITFNGKVLDAACTVTVGDGSSTVELGETVKSDLVNKGDTGAPKLFTITLSSCPAGSPAKANIKFNGETDGDDSYFKNIATTDAATNVGVLLKQYGTDTVYVNDGNTDITLPAEGGDVTVDYTAQLVATGTGVTKGNVVSTLTYSISYQ